MLFTGPCSSQNSRSGVDMRTIFALSIVPCDSIFSRESALSRESADTSLTFSFLPEPHDRKVMSNNAAESGIYNLAIQYLIWS